MPTPLCRPMRPEEVGLAIDWAAAEGWNPGLADDAAFTSVDPQAFWIAEVGGAPAACISVVRYDDAFGFLGFYICRPDLRGKGIGYALWQAGLGHLSGVACIGLDGVVAQQANYRKSGFDLERRNIRFGADRPLAPAAPAGIAVVPAATLPFAEVAAYDRTGFEAPRDAFLRPWLGTPGHVALAALRDDGRLAGYGVLRPARSGARIGPLFADGPEEATALFAGLLAAFPDGPVFLDVPESNAAATAMARASGMAPTFETARMYRGSPPPVRRERVFAVTSLELG